MRRLLILAALTVGGCGDYEPSSDDGGGGSPETPPQWVDTSTNGGGGTSDGGGGSGGGGTTGGGGGTGTTGGGGGGGTGTAGGGGGVPVSTGTPPDSWDGDMPTSTTTHAPAVASGQTYWRLVAGEYYPPEVSATVGGDHHIYFKALDFDGTPLEGQIGLATVFDNTLFAETKAAVDDHWGNIVMFGTGWCSNDINDSPGPYTFKMTQDGLPSHEVRGMGMHCNHHSTWRLIFQKTVAP